MKIVKKILCLFCALIAFINLNAGSLLQDNSLFKEDGKYYLIENGRRCPVNDNVITVKLKNGQGDVDKGIVILRKNKLGYIDVAVPDSVTLEDFACQLDKSGNYELIKYATYGEIYVTPNDQFLDQQWYLDGINMFDAWNYTMGSSNVKIAVIDQIPFFPHVDIYDESASYNNIDWSLGIDYTGGLSPSYHGMSVAGIISAKTNNTIGIAGICGGNSTAGVCIIPYNISIGDNLIDGSCVDDAIIDAVDNGARIINMSFGVSSSNQPDINEAITYAKNHGVLLVASSGNEGSNEIGCLASNPDVIAVGSVGHFLYKSSFSNSGSAIDLVAPGEDIYTLTGTYGYFSRDGTSFSAPIVSAVIGLMLSICPQLSINETRYILESTAHKTSGYTYLTLPEHPNGTWNNYIGYGVVDAYAAVQGAASALARYWQISGPVIPGSPSVYSVPNLWPGWYVEWSMEGQTTLPSYCIVNYPAANQLRINNVNKEHIKGTLIATVYNDSGTLITTLSKFINTADGFVGSYNQTLPSEVLSGHVYDGNTIQARQMYDIVLTSSDFYGATVSCTSSYPNPTISTSGNTITVRLRASTSYSNCLIHCVKGDKVIEFTLRAAPSMHEDPFPPIIASISNNGNSGINIELIVQEENSELMRDSVLDSWELNIYGITTGEHVYSQRVSGSSVSIDTSKWKPDVYIAHIKVGDKEIVKKFSLERFR